MPRESHGQRSLAGYSPWGYKESDVTEETVYILKRIPEKIKNLKNIKLERKEFEKLIDQRLHIYNGILLSQT